MRTVDRGAFPFSEPLLSDYAASRAIAWGEQRAGVRHMAREKFFSASFPQKNPRYDALQQARMRAQQVVARQLH